MLALQEDAPGKVAALGDAINPRYGIFPVRTGLGEGDKLLQADKFGGLVADAAGNNGPQLHLGPGNQAGQSHAADGRGIPFGIFGWAAHNLGAV